MTTIHSAHEIALALGQFPPTAEQQAVIEADPSRPMLVVAGAGSGKTETMASRVVWLVANGHVQPDQVLGLTFTRKAAGQLAERISGRLRALRDAGLWEPEVADDGTPGLTDAPTVLTYHSYAGRLVREQGLRVGIEPDARMLTEAAAWQYANDVVQSYTGPMEDFSKAQSSVTAAVVALAGEMAEHLLDADDVREELRATAAEIESLPPGGRVKKLTQKDLDLVRTLRERAAVLPIVQEYQALKKQHSALDFADQMAVAARLAEGHPGVGALERRRFRVVLLDEFQDTSEAQLRLLRALFAVPGEPVRVTAVGDPHQSIYGWRGASATTLSSFPQQFADDLGDAPVKPLSISWRNDSRVLDVANHVAAPLRKATAVPVLALDTSPAAAEGTVESARYDTVEEEAAAVAEWIVRRRVPGADGALPTCAVLCRKRSFFPFVVDALEQHDLPVEVVGVGGLLMTPEVADLVSLLWIVQDPTRGDRLARLLTGPAVRLGAADIDALGAWAAELTRRATDGIDRDVLDRSPQSREQVSVVEAMENLPRPGWSGPHGEGFSDVARDRLHGLARTVRTLRGLTGLPLADLVGEAERALGLDIEVLSRPGRTPQTARVHLDAFADVASHYSASADRATLGGFLSWLDTAEEEERGLDRPEISTSGDAVQVLTVHAAKGLEWDHVAIPGMVESVFPAHNGVASFKEAHGDWAISKDGTPGEPATWAVNDSGWLSGLDAVPFSMRGDAGALPQFDLASVGDLKELHEQVDDFKRRAGDHAVQEERRLAYVALTRAKHDMLLTSSVWFTGNKPRIMSRFLLELIDAGLVKSQPSAQMPHDSAPTNPRQAAVQSHAWPDDPLARRRAQLEDGWRAAMHALRSVDPVPLEQDPLGGFAVEGEFGEHEHARRREIAVLLHERAAARGRRPRAVLPRHLSASAVVALASDPQAYARELRRPMPTPPALAARRGTEFHAWIEQHYQRAELLDVDELPGSADLDADPDADLEQMKRNFLASEWADRMPVATEVPVETWINGVSVRGRIDAVFDGDDGITIVDWKTGRPPTGLQADARVLQLAAYRIAYARLRGLDPQQVGVAFFHAATGETTRPSLPDDDAIARLISSVPVDGVPQ